MKPLLAILTLAAIIVALASTLIHEDSILWNCLLMGNHHCGNVDHILGFVGRN